MDHCKNVITKGKLYVYFDTGQRKANGKKISLRLPDPRDPSFGAVYAAMKAGRSRRASVAAELTVKAFVDLWQRSPEYRKLAANTQKAYEVYARVLIDQLPTAPAGEVERRDLMLMRDRMADRPGAANGLIRTIRSLYAWGRKRDHVTIDPCKGIDLFDSHDHEPWPQSLLDAALASNDPKISLPVALLYFTAQRIGDVCALRWSDVAQGYVSLTQEKTGKALDILVHEELAARLNSTRKTGITVLADARGRAANVDAVRERLQKFATNLGYKIVPHGLRKNAVNALLEAGCSVAETAAVSGQSLAMVEHYAKQRSGRRLSTAAIIKMQASKP